MRGLFLGLDCSTQSLSGTIIDLFNKKIILKKSVNYDKDLPHYNTKNGVIIVQDPNEIHSYPLMWVEAIDILFNRLKKRNLDIGNIKAISGSGQQHGTVYLNQRFKTALKNLDHKTSAHKQIVDCFSRDTSPIWMDSSTNQQCKEIRESIGGMVNTIKLLGSNTFERFSGPQIRKFYQKSPKKYENTAIIHLVSSFIASLFIGRNAPIDHGDGAGMNLMNIRTKKWSEEALKATAPDLNEKLPPLVESYRIIGSISNYYSNKFGFSEDTKIIAFSGDNPNSLIGVGLVEKGQVAISLGTSDTYFGCMKDLFLDLNGESHVFGAPTGDYMSLICFKNASLTREYIKNKFNLNWKEFSDILSKSKPGNYGKIMLPYLLPEIVPLVLKPKIYRFGFGKNDIEGNVRAIIEAQFLSMRLHSRWIGEKPKIIYATGGASINKDILQVACDIFNIKTIMFETTNSAALGAAIRAAKSYNDSIKNISTWKNYMEEYQFIKKTNMIEPNLKTRKLYDDMVNLYERFENYILKHSENPENERQKFISKYFP